MTHPHLFSAAAAMLIALTPAWGHAAQDLRATHQALTDMELSQVTGAGLPNGAERAMPGGESAPLPFSSLDANFAAMVAQQLQSADTSSALDRQQALAQFKMANDSINGAMNLIRTSAQTTVFVGSVAPTTVIPVMSLTMPVFGLLSSLPHKQQSSDH